MSDQIPSTSTKSAPNTPNSSNQKGKTQVFILSPDILKKLGIASKIPSLTSNKLINTGTQNKTNENKKIELKENNSNQKIGQQKDLTENTAENEFSVKSKLISILTSKLEKEKVKSTSDSLENTFDEQTNIENQIKPKDVINSNLIDTNVLRKVKIEIKKQISDNLLNKDAIHSGKTQKINIASNKVLTCSSATESKLNADKDDTSSSKTNIIKHNTVVSEENPVIKSKIYKSNEITKNNEPVKPIINIPINVKQSSELTSIDKVGKNNAGTKSQICKEKNNIVANKSLSTDDAEGNKSEFKIDNIVIKTKQSKNSEQMNKISITESAKPSFNISANTSLMNEKISTTSKNECNTITKNNFPFDINNTITKEKLNSTEIVPSSTSKKYTSSENECNRKAENKFSCDTNNENKSHIKETQVNKKVKIDAPINKHIGENTLAFKSAYTSMKCTNEMDNDKNLVVNKNSQIKELEVNKACKTIRTYKPAKRILDKQLHKELSNKVPLTNMNTTGEQINKESISTINILDSYSRSETNNVVSNKNSEINKTENINTEDITTNKIKNEVLNKQKIEASHPLSGSLENEFTNQNKTVSSKENLKLNTTEPEHNKTISLLETNELDIKQEMHVTPRGKKRRLTEESPVEDPDSTLSIRKSGRKRKLSSIHSDYITELKLHDGSTPRLTNRRRISSESKSVENVAKEKVNINEENESKTDSDTENENKNDTIILVSQKVSNKTNKNLEMTLVQNINQNKDLTTNAHNNALDSKNTFVSSTEQNKEKEDRHTQISIVEDEIIVNIDNKSDKNQVQNKTNSDTTLNLDVNVFVKTPPKIIIHENILITPPTQENFTVLIPKRKYGKNTQQTECNLSKDSNLKSSSEKLPKDTDKPKEDAVINKNTLEKQTNIKYENVQFSTKSNENVVKEKINVENTKEKDLKTDSNIVITPARGRGRPRKPVTEIENSDLDSKKNEDSNETPTPRRRGRPPKKITTEETVDTPEKSENEELPNSNTTFYATPRRKGRPPKNEALKRKIEDLEKNESSSKAKTVVCAVCNTEIKTPLWSAHALKHNFLCWKVGETPLDLNDRKLLEYVLFKSIKNNNRFKTFVCTECGDKKKSVLGFLAHRDVCQLTEEERIGLMLTCEICSRKIMPQSMRYHMKSHEEENIKVEKIGEINNVIEEDRTKRKAATKAANLIQEVSSKENIPIVISDEKENIQNRKMYKKIKESGSMFMNFGLIKRFIMLFKQGKRKCKFETCEFESDDFDKLKKHMASCPKVNPEHFICKFCQLVNEDEDVMINHVRTHEKKYEEFITNISSSESEDEGEEISDEISEDEEDEELSTSKSRKSSKPSTEYGKLTVKIGFLACERRAMRNRVTSYLPALKWTQKFREQVYSDVLFDNIKCLASDWVSVQSNEYEKYLPYYRKSMSVNTCSLAYTIPNLQQKEHEWKEYDIYETDNNNDTANIFCGGPITAMAWVPTPLNVDCDQILAVSIQKDFEATYKISESVYGSEMIQFWNFGPLNFSKTNVTLPSLEFSIAHNHGMVWCMEWCPSGYYDTEESQDSEELTKLGLLALACSDGNIPIYAVGIPEKNENVINNMYKVKPQYKLILQETSEKLLGTWKYQVTKVSWSKGKNHNIIAGGYSNGVVCLWDLTNTSPLLQYEKNGVKILKPYHTFLAHTSAVSALVLYPFIDEGKRWLLTGSWDRTFKYWDVNNTSSPVSSFGKRGIVTDGVWITHWLCSYFSFDDVFSLGHTVTTVQNPREFGFKQCSALASNSVVMGLSANDWASACAQGTLAGELITTFPRMILISYDVDKNLKSKRMMFSYNELIDKTKDISERKDIMRLEKKQEIANDNEKDDTVYSKYIENNSEPYVEEPVTYEKAKEKYGLLFCDFKLNNFNMLPEESLNMVKQSCRLREVPTELYPFTSLNKIAWNPNKQAYLYIACGYQNGFVRLRCVRFMNPSKKES